MILVLAVTALMTTMMVSAGPANALSVGGGSSIGGSMGNISSSGVFISGGGSSVNDVDFGGISFISDGVDLDISGIDVD